MPAVLTTVKFYEQLGALAYGG